MIIYIFINKSYDWWTMLVDESSFQHKLRLVTMLIFFPLLQIVTSTINTLVGALYKVFSPSSDSFRKEMCQACFDYLSLEGVFSNVPIALL